MSETIDGDNVSERFEVGLDDSLAEAWAEPYEHLESHRNDSATSTDLELMLLKYDPGLLRPQLRN